MKTIVKSMIVTFSIVGVLFCAYMFSVQAKADPVGPCGYYSNVPWSVCAEIPPYQNYPGGSWDFNPKPGQMGPGGYEPCTPSRGCHR